jgi:hypothetical protein
LVVWAGFGRVLAASSVSAYGVEVHGGWPITRRVVVNEGERCGPFADRRPQASRGWTSEADCVPTDTSVCMR